MSIQPKLAHTWSPTLAGRTQLLVYAFAVPMILLLLLQTVALGQTVAPVSETNAKSALPEDLDGQGLSSARMLRTGTIEPAPAGAARSAMVEPAISDAGRPKQPGQTWKGTLGTVGFWSVQAAMWTAVFYDGNVSGTGTNCVEANSWFADSNGRFQRGKYYAVNVPVSAAATAVGAILNHKAGNSRYGSLLRVLAVAPASTLAIAHTHAALGWVHNCR
ncbi:MAG: hypothetical protein ACE14M_02430 [Terriglobales bacterium]